MWIIRELSRAIAAWTSRVHVIGLFLVRLVSNLNTAIQSFSPDIFKMVSPLDNFDVDCYEIC